MIWMLGLLTTVLAASAFIVLGLAWVRLGVRRRRRSAALVHTANERLREDPDRLAADFLLARHRRHADRPQSTVALHGGASVIAWDKATAELVALVAIEPDKDGTSDAIDPATAVFVWRERRWQTDGQAIHKLSPEQTLHRYAKRLARAA